MVGRVRRIRVRHIWIARFLISLSASLTLPGCATIAPVPGADEQFLGIVGPRLPEVHIRAVKHAHARTRPGSDSISIGDCHFWVSPLAAYVPVGDY